jgi:uncharacterized protein with LGFP repeats
MTIQLYSFSIDNFTISETRSRHKDTDYISASVAVAGRPTLSANQKLGDLDNGTFPTAMQFTGVPVGDDETAVFTYLIVNSGHSDPGEAEKATETAAKTLAEKGAQAAATAVGGAIGAALGASIGTAIVPLIGTALGALASWVVTSVGALLFADCDGPVAAAVHTYTGHQLRAGTSLGLKLTDSDHHPGVDSAHGCGANSIYDVRWTIVAQPFRIGPAITEKWNALGGAGGFLGSPQTDETTCPDGVGHFVHFDNGSIYWTPKTGALSVHGDIRAKWASLGWERCPFLGYPITDETGCPDGVGRFNHFQNGSIYWTPKTGALSVHGDIRAKWASLGWERSSLGYPISDEHDEAGGRGSEFQHGRILWQPGKGAWVA